MIDKEEEEYGGQHVNGHVDQMVSKDPVSSKIVIKGKTETGYGPEQNTLLVKEGLLHIGPGKFCQMKSLTVQDVWIIIKLPACIEGVRIYDKNQERQGKDCKDFFTAFGKGYLGLKTQ